jgi:hypothetical protein
LLTENAIAKTFRKEAMTDSTKAKFLPLISIQGKNKIIHGYVSTAYQASDTSKSDFMTAMHLQPWYADSLFFPVSPSQILYEMVPLFTNGKSINLGMKTQMTNDTTPILQFVVQSVTAAQLPDSIFVLPKDYMIETRIDHDLDIDSTIAIVDTTTKITKQATGKNKKPAIKTRQNRACKSLCIKAKRISTHLKKSLSFVPVYEKNRIGNSGAFPQYHTNAFLCGGAGRNQRPAQASYRYRRF